MMPLNYFAPVLQYYPQNQNPAPIGLTNQLIDLSFNSSNLTFGQPSITDDGYISLMVNQDVGVDINANTAIRISIGQCTVAINHSGTSMGMIDQYGRVLQEGNDIYLTSGTRMAKMSIRGVSFASRKRSLIYLVDSSGCKTTTERFRKLNHDIVKDVFTRESLHGQHARQRAMAVLMQSTYKVFNHNGIPGEEVWQFGGIRIRQRYWGEVQVSKSFGRILISVAPKEKLIEITTPSAKAVIRYDYANYCLEVSKTMDEQSIVVSGQRFKVKMGSQKAGFDGHERLTLS